MENTVTLTLEKYEEIITENILLKNKIEGLKLQADELIIDEILDGKIGSINDIEVIKNSMLLSDNKLLNEYTHGYSWTWRSISSKCIVLSEREVEQRAVSLIKKMLDERLQDLFEMGRENNENQKF